MSTPPGWYPDTQMPGTRRYWDGNKWTNNVAPLEQKQVGFWTLTRAVALGILGAVAAIAFIASCQASQDQTDCHIENIDRITAGEPVRDCGD